MIKAYFEDIMDFSLLSISFIFTLFITNLNQMLEIHITTEILSDLYFNYTNNNFWSGTL